MVAVFRGVRRVLRDDGVLWLNLGDSYSGGSGGNATNSDKQKSNAGTMNDPNEDARKGYSGLPSGNLVGVPWRVALALQADGWILRSDVPWVKRNSMPESVTNRPGKAVENVFLLVKSMNYFFDMEEVRHKGKGVYRSTDFIPNSDKDLTDSLNHTAATGASRSNRSNEMQSGRGFRSADLWFESVNSPHGAVGIGDDIVGLDVPVGSFAGAHFATFSPRLITPLILSGTSAYGCCSKCGTPWGRILTSSDGRGVMDDGSLRATPPGQSPQSHHRDRSLERNRNGITGSLDNGPKRTNTVAWTPKCQCCADVVPCTVLDPFVGSGTTCMVALKHGRRGIGIDLSDSYLTEFAIPRIQATEVESQAEMPEAPAPTAPPIARV
jgi:hypothetical protein